MGVKKFGMATDYFIDVLLDKDKVSAYSEQRGLSHTLKSEAVRLANLYLNGSLDLTRAEIRGLSQEQGAEIGLKAKARKFKENLMPAEKTTEETEEKLRVVRMGAVVEAYGSDLLGIKDKVKGDAQARNYLKNLCKENDLKLTLDEDKRKYTVYDKDEKISQTQTYMALKNIISANKRAEQAKTIYYDAKKGEDPEVDQRRSEYLRLKIVAAGGMDMAGLGKWCEKNDNMEYFNDLRAEIETLKTAGYLVENEAGQVTFTDIAHKKNLGKNFNKDIEFLTKGHEMILTSNETQEHPAEEQHEAAGSKTRNRT